MKGIALVLAAAVVAMGGLAIVQSRKLTEQQRTVAELKNDLEQKTRQIEELESARTRMDQQRRDLLQTTDELQAEVRTQQSVAKLASITNPPPATTNDDSPKTDKAGFGGFLSKMMQDPDTKKFIRDQQRLMMDQLYNPLIKHMGLSPEEAAKFKDLISDNMMQSAEKATSMFGGSASNRTELVSTLASAQKDFDEQMKAFLGEDRFAAYKDYQETVGERTQLNLFKQQNAGSDYPLNDLQTEQLLGLMKEEKRNVAASMGQNAPGMGQDQANLQAMLSEEQADKTIQFQEAVNQRVFERARTILSPDQLQAFGNFQTSQLQMMRMGMSMARKFLAPDQPEGGASN